MTGRSRPEAVIQCVYKSRGDSASTIDRRLRAREFAATVSKCWSTGFANRRVSSVAPRFRT